jgi:hypothetical protein
VREKGALNLWQGGEACGLQYFDPKPPKRGGRSSPERGGTMASSSIWSRREEDGVAEAGARK